MRASRLKLWKTKPSVRLRTSASSSRSSVADVAPVEQVAARGRAIEAAEDVHQRRLARARRAHDRDELARRRSRARRRASALHLDVAQLVDLGRRRELDERRSPIESASEHRRSARRLPAPRRAGSGGARRRDVGDQRVAPLRSPLDDLGDVPSVMPMRIDTARATRLRSIHTVARRTRRVPPRRAGALRRGARLAAPPRPRRGRRGAGAAAGFAEQSAAGWKRSAAFGPQRRRSFSA